MLPTSPARVSNARAGRPGFRWWRRRPAGLRIHHLRGLPSRRPLAETAVASQGQIERPRRAVPRRLRAGVASPPCGARVASVRGSRRLRAGSRCIRCRVACVRRRVACVRRRVVCVRRRVAFVRCRVASVPVCHLGSRFMRWRVTTTRSFWGPQVGCLARAATRSWATSAATACGWGGALDRSTSASTPPHSYRSFHLYPCFLLIPKRSHSSTSLLRPNGRGDKFHPLVHR